MEQLDQIEQLIDIQKFLIVKSEHLDTLILNLGVNLNKTNDTYLLTLILANIFAYLVIYIFIALLLKISKHLFKRNRRIF